jgi:acetyl/propionyl-CoA carboxylase alpha subunit
VTKGNAGMSVTSPQFFGADLASSEAFYYIALGTTVLVTLGVLILLDASGKWLGMAGFPVAAITWSRYMGHLLLVLALFVPTSGLRVLHTQSPGRQLLRGALMVAVSLALSDALPDGDAERALLALRSALPDDDAHKLVDADVVRETMPLAVAEAHAERAAVEISSQTNGVASVLHVALLMRSSRVSGTVVRQGGRFDVFVSGKCETLTLKDPLASTGQAEADHAGSLTAPMPGKIIAIEVKAGEKVKRGQALLVMEAMKMEHTINAGLDGVVENIFFGVGEQVAEGAVLISLTQ